jgi:tRNA(Ile)-lysidine synthase
MTRSLTSPPSVERRVAAFIADSTVLRAGEKALLLLSGGADSMALLAILPRASRRLRLGLRLRALHVDYATRGADSDRDRRIVEEACAALRVPLDVVRLERKLAGADFQRRARQVRYRAAREVRARESFDVIVTAHNRDDQAETVLYRLTKYAAPSSLVGMRPREGDLARPLLCLSAAEIRSFCAARGVACGEDVSNATTVYARNLLRHEVLPVLARINPSVVQTLADGAEVAAAEREVLKAAVDEAWGRVAVGGGGGGGGRGRPPIQRRLLAGLLDLAGTTVGVRRLALPEGREAVREYGRLRLTSRGRPHECEPVVVEAGGTAIFCGRRFALRVLAQAPPAERLADHGASAFLAPAAPVRRLVLRHPRPGDAFRPLGMSATVSLSRFLAAAKVPADGRERAVVAEAEGTLAWVLPAEGVRGRVAEDFRVGCGSGEVLHLFEETRP